MLFYYVKAVHVIFVVTWFAGLFYLPRLLIYNREAADLAERERRTLQNQFNGMMSRLLYAITMPSAIITLLVGGWLLYLYPTWPTWLLIKICLVMLLYMYQGSLHVLVNQQLNNKFSYSSNQLRIWNEVPTVLLVGIVFLVVVKNNLSLIYGLIGLAALILLILSGIRVYAAYRNK